MPFTVNPGETQAMQEDEVQLLHAISQTTRTALGLLKQSPAQQKPESPEIRMNGRAVYGAMADGVYLIASNNQRLKGLIRSNTRAKLPRSRSGTQASFCFARKRTAASR
jgi:hypothetical protein